MCICINTDCKISKNILVSIKVHTTYCAMVVTLCTCRYTACRDFCNPFAVFMTECFNFFCLCMTLVILTGVGKCTCFCAGGLIFFRKVSAFVPVVICCRNYCACYLNCTAAIILCVTCCTGCCTCGCYIAFYMCIFCCVCICVNGDYCACYLNCTAAIILCIACCTRCCTCGCYIAFYMCIFCCVSISIYSNFFRVLGSVTYCTCECLYAFFCTGGILCYYACVPCMVSIYCESNITYVAGIVCYNYCVFACCIHKNTAANGNVKSVESCCYVKVVFCLYGNISTVNICICISVY